MTFKKLILDRECVDKFLNERRQNGQLKKETPSGKQINYEFHIEGKTCLLAIYRNDNGTTTLNPNVGQAQDLSEKIAIQIREKCKLSDQQQASCTFKKLDAEGLSLVLDFIKEEIPESSIGLQADNAKDIQYAINGRVGDKVSLTYYKTTGTALLQGKPLPIFHSVKLFFYEIVSEENIIEVENEVFGTALNASDCRTALRKYLPTSYGFLDEKIKKIITPCLTIDQINGAFEDYSCFCFPALRGLEGYIKQLLKKSYPEYNGTNVIGKLFTDISPYSLADHVTNAVNCQKTIEAIEKSYNFYHSRRHPYFHIDKVIEATPIIATKEAAQALNVEVFDLIEATYSRIP